MIENLLFVKLFNSRRVSEGKPRAAAAAARSFAAWATLRYAQAEKERAAAAARGLPSLTRRVLTLNSSKFESFSI